MFDSVQQNTRQIGKNVHETGKQTTTRKFSRFEQNISMRYSFPHCSFPFSKCFLSTGPTMKWSAAPKPTSAAMVYMVSL